MIDVVTSMSKDIWDRYGRACVESLVSFWPEEANLHIVTEDGDYMGWTGLRDVVYASRLGRVTVHQLLYWMDARYFLGRHENNRRAHGFWNGTDYSDYQFRYDAYRFCKKVYAVEMVVNKLRGGSRVFWIDADCVTHMAMPIELLDRLPPEGFAAAHFARPNYTETGFIGYDLRHPMTRPFISAVAQVFTSDRIFTMKEWHDCWAWDRTREEMNVPTYAIPYPVGQTHPLVFSELGRYMDHRKGPRKKLPASPEHPVYGRR